MWIPIVLFLVVCSSNEISRLSSVFSNLQCIPKYQKFGFEAISDFECDYEEKSYIKERFDNLIFEDEFDFLDMETWRHEITLGGGGNSEFQFYNNDRRTSFVRDGKLYIKPMLTSDYLRISDTQLMEPSTVLDLWGNAPGFQCTANGNNGCYKATKGDDIINPIMSAQLRSVNSLDFKYGRVEIRAKIPRGDWLWPAIWLLPTHHAYGGWPASGEIDILESRGNSNNCYGDGIDTVSSTLHWGPHYTQNRFDLTTNKFVLDHGTFNDRFHIFTLEWSENYLRTYVDDELNLDVDFTKQSMYHFGNFSNNFHNPWQNSNLNAPFDQKFYLIINLAVGGTNSFFTDTPQCKHHKRSHKPWANNQPNPAKQFLLAKQSWYPTWFDHNLDQSAFILDYIRVYSD